jgi:hypothetical protein
MKSLISILLFGFGLHIIQAGPLPLRNEILLNGIWTFTPGGAASGIIPVPDYWDAHDAYKSVDRAVYKRMVSIPSESEWEDKQIFLEFDGVNFITEVFIDDKSIGTHIGGWVPFKFNITRFVKPGKSFELKVEVKGGNQQPVVDENGAPQWPVGFIGQTFRWGIIFDVWLRAYGMVGIEDAYIITSFRNKELAAEYTITNFSGKKQIVRINAVVSAEMQPLDKLIEVSSETLEFKPGETRTIKLTKQWNMDYLWSPSDPALLYLKSSIVMTHEKTGGEIIDCEMRRFGFREIWTEGNKLMFNGHPFTIMGTNIVQHSEFHLDQRYWYTSPESWNTTIDRLFELNLRTVRFHMQPAPKFMLEMADERGLLVMDESTIYAREYVLESNKEVYLANSKKWIEPWIKARRNHPSVIVWNAENEMGIGWINWLTPEELKSLGDEIRRFDTTRPVNYDGDRDVGDDMVNYHYIEGYKNEVSGSIYDWADSVHTEKPTGVGEFITHYGENGLKNQWWQGTWVRGMRYVGFADIRPYRHDWALLSCENNERTDNLRNGFSPVALFDKEYDDLGIDPLLFDNYPVVMAGDTANRILILYNDEFADTIITIEVVIKSSWMHEALSNYNGEAAFKQEIIAWGTKTFAVPLGCHVEIPYSFEIPALRQGIIDRIDVELIARKKGQVKFREVKTFALRGREFKGRTSGEVMLGEPQE